MIISNILHGNKAWVVWECSCAEVWTGTEWKAGELQELALIPSLDVSCWDSASELQLSCEQLDSADV
jgi:hypothetical protein